MTDLERARRIFLTSLDHTVPYRLFTVIEEKGEKKTEPILVTAKWLDEEYWEKLIRNLLGVHQNQNLDGKHLDFIFYSEEDHTVRKFWDLTIIDAKDNKMGDELSKYVNIPVFGTNIRFFFVQINKGEEPNIVGIYDTRKMARVKIPEPKTGLDD